MTFKAVLWDCDGCLIDSEHVVCELAARLLTEAGYSITTEQFVTRFCGQSKKAIIQAINDDSGMDFTEHMHSPQRKELQWQAFRDELKAIPHIEFALDQIKVPMAIVSGSEMDRLEYTLKLTNLYNRFDGLIYNSSMVTRGKPHPDVFLYAANKMDVAPQDCLVIEDSINGVMSGKAAGMTVFGFTGGSHVLDKQAHERILLDLGADRVLHDMRELPRYML